MKRTINVGVGSIAALCGMAGSVFAIDGPNAGPAGDAPYWYVGRVQDAATPLNRHAGTGSAVAPGVVLTCAHVINEAVNADNNYAMAQGFERFQLNSVTQPFFALGVQHPGYRAQGLPGAALSPLDIGFMLTLNGLKEPPMNAANPQRPFVFPSLMGAPGTGLAPAGLNELAGVAGYSSSNFAASARRAGAFTVTGQQADGVYRSVRAAGVVGAKDYTQPGDSGGPWVQFRQNPDPNGLALHAIFGVTRSGDAKVWPPPGAAVAGMFSEAVPVAPYRGFVEGNGTGGVRAVDRLVLPAVPPAALTWLDPALWERTAARINLAPQEFDIAVLDLTAGSDTGTTVRVMGAPAALDGLLNDVTLDVFAALNVTASNLGMTGTSGALNGGVINVMQGGSLAIGSSLDNVVDNPDNMAPPPGGKITLRPGSTARIGQLVPAGSADTVFNNGKAAQVIVDRAEMRVDHRMDNAGTVTVSGVAARVDIGTFLPEKIKYVTGPRPGPDDIIAPPMTEERKPIAVLNGAFNTAATFSVGPGATLNVTNAPFSTAVFDNRAMGVFEVFGDANAAAAANIDCVENGGAFKVGANSTLNAARATMNFAFGSLEVSGGAAGVATANAGALTNFSPSIPAPHAPGGAVSVGFKGVLNVNRPALEGAGLALDNRFGAFISINPGGAMNVTGEARNAGRLTIKSDDNAQGGRGVVTALRAGVNAKPFTNEGHIDFVRIAGEKPVLSTQSTDFINKGTIRGPGELRLKGDSKFDNQVRPNAAAPSPINLNLIDLIFDGASRPNGDNPALPVTLELMSHDSGGTNLNEFMQPLALASLCITGSSTVKVVDGFANEDAAAGSEVIYAWRLGVAAGSTLDLMGKTLYYYEADLDCGFDATRIVNGGNLKQVPAPASLALLTIVSLKAGRRRRGTLV